MAIKISKNWIFLKHPNRLRPDHRHRTPTNIYTIPLCRLTVIGLHFFAVDNVGIFFSDFYGELCKTHDLYSRVRMTVQGHPRSMILIERA